MTRSRGSRSAAVVQGAAAAVAIGGQPLPPVERAYFEPRFGFGFSNVRVHDDPAAHSAAEAVNARAFTIGRHIGFARGEYRPKTENGRFLMAHELAHVVQQTSGEPRVARQLETEPSAAGSEQPTPTTEEPTPSEVLVLADQIRGEVDRPQAPEGKGGKVESGTPPLAQDERSIPSATVTCVKKWKYCHAPYRPGTWAARTTYHCPVFIPPIILPGTTRPAFVTIPDEFIGKGPRGADKFRCRPRASVVAKTALADAAAAIVNRNLLYPDFASCHAGYRQLLRAALEVAFRPSGGGRPAGIRVNQAAPGGGARPFPCP